MGLNFTYDFSQNFSFGGSINVTQPRKPDYKQKLQWVTNHSPTRCWVRTASWKENPVAETLLNNYRLSPQPPPAASISVWNSPISFRDMPKDYNKMLRTSTISKVHKMALTFVSPHTGCWQAPPLPSFPKQPAAMISALPVCTHDASLPAFP